MLRGAEPLCMLLLVQVARIALQVFLCGHQWFLYLFSCTTLLLFVYKGHCATALETRAFIVEPHICLNQAPDSHIRPRAGPTDGRSPSSSSC